MRPRQIFTATDQYGDTATIDAYDDGDWTITANGREVVLRPDDIARLRAVVLAEAPEPEPVETPAGSF